MTTERYVTPAQAADAIRGIASRWRDCTKIAGLARKSSGPKASEAPAVVAGLVEEILQAAAFVAQGDERDLPALAKDVADMLCSKGGEA